MESWRLSAARNTSAPPPSLHHVPNRTHSHQRIALLMVGLLRGVKDETHLQWLQQFVSSLGDKVGVFGFFEARFATNNESCTQREFWDWKRAFHHTANFRLATKQQLMEQEEVAVQWKLLTGGSMNTNALKQFYKTRKAFEMMAEHENRHGFRYSHLLRVRIDANGTVGSGWLARNVERLRERTDAALLFADYAWLAGREAGERLSLVWSNILHAFARCSTSSQSRLVHAFLPLNWCRIADSPWAARCSLFATVANLPSAVANSSTSTAADIVGNARRACAHPAAAAAPKACSNDTNRVWWFGGFFNPQYQLGLSLFAAGGPEPSYGGHPGPITIQHVDCLEGGPTDLIMAKEARHSLTCR